jgi:helix-turn-helix protein
MLKKGDKVKISPSSEFYGQNDGLGVIIGSHIVGGEIWFDVLFEDGYDNCYLETDLINILDKDRIKSILQKLDSAKEKILNLCKEKKNY